MLATRYAFAYCPKREESDALILLMKVLGLAQFPHV